MRLKLAPKLRPLPELGMHQITASQLATNGMDGNPIYKSDHIGRAIAVRANGALLAGKLCAVTDSATSPLLVLEIGYHKVAVHPTHPVTVAPEGYQLNVVARPKPEGEQQ